MKKLIFTISLLCSLIFASAQDITLGRNQTLYHIPNPNIEYGVRQHVPWNGVIQTTNLIPGKWKIVKFTNMGNHNTKNYDAMIIQTSGKFKSLERRTYLVRYQDLSDEYKKIIDNANFKLDSIFVAKQNRIADLEDEIENEKHNHDISVDEYIQIQLKEKEDSILYIKRKCDSLLVKAKASIVRAVEYQKDSLMRIYTSKEKDIFNHIAFTKVSLHTDSAGGNDITINYINTSNKTIKYIWFNCDYYNRVDDKVLCEIRGAKLSRLKETGPVLPGSEGEGGEWEHVIYNHSAEYVIIKNIQINYMDGSTWSVSLSKKEFEQLLSKSKILEVCNELTKFANSIPDSIEDKRNQIVFKTNLAEWVANHSYTHYHFNSNSIDILKEKWVDIVSRISKIYTDTVEIYSNKCSRNIRVFQNDWEANGSKLELLSKAKYNLENDRTEYEINVNENWKYYIVNK